MGNIPFLTNVDVRGNLTIGTLRGTENEAYALNLLDTNSVIAFGDNSLTTTNVIVGEYGTTDTDQLWLHGKNGTKFTYNGGGGGEAIDTSMVIDDVGRVIINATSTIPNRTENFQVTGQQIITNTGTNNATLYLGYNSSGANSVQLGRGRTSDGLSYIDLNGEVMVAGNYGFRIMRRAGVNAITDLIQVGTGSLTINALNGADTVFTNTDVGIGTTNPADKLHVMGTVRSVVDTGSGFGFMTNRGTGVSCCGIRWDNNKSSLTLKDSTNAITTHIRSSGFSYLNGGNVGIGTNVPTQAKLVVSGNVAFNQGDVAMGQINPELERLDFKVDNGVTSATPVAMTLRDYAGGARLGIGKINPEASLDVGRNARVRGSLNVGATNEQYLFVSTTGDTPVGYVKMGYYGQGTDYDLTNDPTATPQYTSAFGSGGRVVEDIRYYTFKLTRAQMAALNSTPKTLIPAESGYNFFIEDAYIFQNNNSGTAPSYNSGNITLDYVYSNGATVTAASVDATIANSNRNYRKIIGLQRQPYIYGNSSALATMGVQLNAPSASNNGSGNVTYFLRLKVKKVNILNDISSNTQIITVS